MGGHTGYNKCTVSADLVSNNMHVNLMEYQTAGIHTNLIDLDYSLAEGGTRIQLQMNNY